MEVLTGVDRGRIEALQARDEFFWLDLEAPSGEELDAVGRLLGLHELALEDTREFGQRAKLDRYPDGVLLVVWTARVSSSEPGVELVEVHLHIAGGYLFSARSGGCAALDELHRALAPEQPETEDYVLYRVLDTLVDALYPVVDALEARIDALEGAILRDADRRQLTDIYRLKQDVQLLQRRLVPLRDQFPAATEAILALPGLTRGSREYLRDVGDHLTQVTGELARQAEDLGALTSTYFNANANRLNRLATRLTVMATSCFGQNFLWLTNHIDTLEAFVFYETVGLVLPTLAAAVYFWRRRREWL